MKSILTFGKYKNKNIKDVFKKDKQYIIWLCKQEWFEKNHNELFILSKKTLDEYEPVINKNKFIIYTDGACPNNGSINAKASIGIHFSDKNPIKLNDVSEVLYIDDPSNNVAELSAIYKSLQMIKDNQIDINDKPNGKKKWYGASGSRSASEHINLKGIESTGKGSTNRVQTQLMSFSGPDQTTTKTALARCRGGGCIAPKKKGAN